MSTPAIRPARMAKYIFQFAAPSTKYTNGKEAIAIRIAEKLVPRLRAASRFFCVAPSLVLTKNVPRIEHAIPTAAMSIGRANAEKLPNAATPSAAAEMTEPT